MVKEDKTCSPNFHFDEHLFLCPKRIQQMLVVTVMNGFCYSFYPLFKTKLSDIGEGWKALQVS
jgi:hypothetical protein